MSEPQTIKGVPNITIDRNNNEVVIEFDTNKTSDRKLIVFLRHRKQEPLLSFAAQSATNTSTTSHMRKSWRSQENSYSI